MKIRDSEKGAMNCATTNRCTLKIRAIREIRDNPRFRQQQTSNTQTHVPSEHAARISTFPLKMKYSSGILIIRPNPKVMAIVQKE